MRIETTPDKAKYATVEGVTWTKTEGWSSWPWSAKGMPSMTTDQLALLDAKFETGLEAPEGYGFCTREEAVKDVKEGKVYCGSAKEWVWARHKCSCCSDAYAIPLKPKQPSVVVGKVMGVPLEGFIKTSLDELTEVYVAKKERVLLDMTGLTWNTNIVLKPGVFDGKRVRVLIISEEE